MAAEYPNAVPSFAGMVGTPGVSPQNAPSQTALFQKLADEVAAIAAELGINPSAAYATVLLRLAAIDTAAAAAITKATLDANSVLVADTDDTPVARVMGASTILARLAAGGVVAATPAEIRTLLSLVIGTNVQAWDADLDTLAAGGAPATAYLVSLLNGTYVALTDYEDLDVLAKVKNVDGAGSGLDADLLDGANLSVDGTLAGNSDALVPTQKAVKTYADQIIASADAMVFKGVIDASANPNYPAADRGHTYRISVAGKIGGAAGPNVEAGDLLVALTDGTAAGNHATVGGSWSIAQTNLDGAVIGPAGAADGSLVLFDGATGRLIKDGGVVVSAFIKTVLDDADAAAARTTLGTDAVYAPLAGAALFLFADDISGISGSPAVTQTGVAGVRGRAWALDAASEESIYGVIPIPAGWATANVILWWTNGGAGAGDVVWRVDRTSITTGTDIGTETAGANVTATAPVTNIIAKATGLSGIAVTPGHVLRVEVVRVAANASDTLVNDAWVFAIELQRAS